MKGSSFKKKVCAEHIEKQRNSKTPSMIPTKVVLFAAFFVLAVATDAHENSGLQKNVEQNVFGPEVTEEVMAKIQSKVGGPRGEEELDIPEPKHYRTKRSFTVSERKYLIGKAESVKEKVISILHFSILSS